MHSLQRQKTSFISHCILTYDAEAYLFLNMAFSITMEIFSVELW